MLNLKVILSLFSLSLTQLVLAQFRGQRRRRGNNPPPDESYNSAGPIHRASRTTVEDGQESQDLSSTPINHESHVHEPTTEEHERIANHEHHHPHSHENHGIAGPFSNLLNFGRSIISSGSGSGDEEEEETPLQKNVKVVKENNKESLKVHQNRHQEAELQMSQNGFALDLHIQSLMNEKQIESLMYYIHSTDAAAWRPHHYSTDDSGAQPVQSTKSLDLIKDKKPVVYGDVWEKHLSTWHGLVLYWVDEVFEPEHEVIFDTMTIVKHQHNPQADDQELPLPNERVTFNEEIFKQGNDQFEIMIPLNKKGRDYSGGQQWWVWPGAKDKPSDDPNYKPAPKRSAWRGGRNAAPHFDGKWPRSNEAWPRANTTSYYIPHTPVGSMIMFPSGLTHGTSSVTSGVKYSVYMKVTAPTDLSEKEYGPVGGTDPDAMYEHENDHYIPPQHNHDHDDSSDKDESDEKVQVTFIDNREKNHAHNSGHYSMYSEDQHDSDNAEYLRIAWVSPQDEIDLEEGRTPRYSQTVMEWFESGGEYSLGTYAGHKFVAVGRFPRDDGSGGEVERMVGSWTIENGRREYRFSDAHRVRKAMDL